MYSSAYVWAKVLRRMEDTLSPDVISTWFDEVDIIELSDKRLVLKAPSEFIRNYIEERMFKYIDDAMRELFGAKLEYEVLCGEDAQSYQSRAEKLDFMEFNPQFNFDSFVVGPSNRFAHAAARAVADHPADSYNPLYIYGPSGLGKTHLLYAIAAQIHQQNPNSNIVYIKGDQFTNELITAVQSGKNVEFRKKYRTADLFLIDDIQFIAGKESTQEEFFHTFNTLWEEHKQIVLTSDRPPEEIANLEERLRTRFEWGILADVQPPDYETRMAIIKNKADSFGLQMPDDVCEYIAENVTANVRQLEGTVKKIKMYRDISMITMNVEGVARVIKDLRKDSTASPLPTPKLIITEVCRFYSFDEALLYSPLKNKNTVEARHLAMYLIQKMISLSTPEIGRIFNRDHSTVLHAIEQIEKKLASNNTQIENNIRDITANINSRL